MTFSGEGGLPGAIDAMQTKAFIPVNLSDVKPTMRGEIEYVHVEGTHSLSMWLPKSELVFAADASAEAERPTPATPAQPEDTAAKAPATTEEPKEEKSPDPAPEDPATDGETPPEEPPSGPVTEQKEEESELELFKSGTEVAVSGIYRGLDKDGKPTDHTATCVAGEKFPPHKPGMSGGGWALETASKGS